MCVFGRTSSIYLSKATYSTIYKLLVLTISILSRQIVIETVVSLIICFAAGALLSGRLRPIKVTQIAALKYVGSFSPPNLRYLTATDARICD